MLFLGKNRSLDASHRCQPPLYSQMDHERRGGGADPPRGFEPERARLRPLNAEGATADLPIKNPPPPTHYRPIPAVL